MVFCKAFCISNSESGADENEMIKYLSQKDEVGFGKQQGTQLKTYIWGGFLSKFYIYET